MRLGSSGYNWPCRGGGRFPLQAVGTGVPMWSLRASKGRLMVRYMVRTSQGPLNLWVASRLCSKNSTGWLWCPAGALSRRRRQALRPSCVQWRMIPVQCVNKRLATLISFMDSRQITVAFSEFLGNSTILIKLLPSSIEMFNELFSITWHMSDVKSVTPAQNIYSLPSPHLCFIPSWVLYPYCSQAVLCVYPSVLSFMLRSSTHSLSQSRGKYMSPRSLFGQLVLWRHVFIPQPTSSLRSPWRMVKVTHLRNFQRIRHLEVGSSQSTNLLIWGASFLPSILSLVFQSTPAFKGTKTKIPTDLSERQKG